MASLHSKRALEDPPPPTGLPPISVAQPELPDGDSFAHAKTAAAEEVRSVSGSGAPQYIREMIAEVKPFPEDIQALTVDPSLVAYLSQLYRNSHAEQSRSFTGGIPPSTPAVTSATNKKSSWIIRVLTFAAESVGLSEQWALVRRLSPSPLSDLSEAFRLYFGSNITIFPYLLSLGGTVGAVISAVPIAYLLDVCVEMQCEAKDVAVNIILKKLVAQDRSQFFGTEVGGPSPSSHLNKTLDHQLKELEDFSARHLSVSSYFQLAEVLWTFPKTANTGIEPETSQNVAPPANLRSGGSSDEGRLKLNIQTASPHHDNNPNNGGGAAATTATFPDLDPTELSTAQQVPPPPTPEVEVRSIIPTVVRLVVGIAQFTSTCSFAILIASNMQALGMASLNLAMVISCVGMLSLLITLTPNTLALFAMINNICLLGGSVILIIATLEHQSATSSDGTTTEGGSEDVWLFFRTPTDAFMFFPTLFAYITPALFAVDVETNIARRCIQRVVAKLTGGRERSLATPAAVASPTTRIAAPHHNDVEELFPSQSTPSTATATFVPSSAILIKRFHHVTFIALVLALTVLLSFGEFIFMNFKSNTNAVIALSLRPGFLRSLLLWDLIIGIFACGALNVVGLPNILDDLRLREVFGLAISKPVERVAIRVGIMVVVLMTLFVIPYFDLIASLAGCLGVNGFTFFLPVLFYLQGIRRRAESDERDDHVIHLSPGSVSSSSSPSALLGKGQHKSDNIDHHHRPLISYWAAFRRVKSVQMQGTIVVMLTLGSVVFVTGVGSVISQLISRLSSDSTS